MIPENRSGRLREGKQRRWESQSKAVSSSWSWLWAVLSSLLEPSVELSRTCLGVVHLKGGKEGPYLAALTTFVLLPWLTLQNGYVAMAVHGQGRRSLGAGEADIYVGRRVHELVAAVTGWSKNAGKEDVRWGTRGVWYFLLPECSLLLLKPQSDAVIKSIFHAWVNISRDLIGFVQAEGTIWKLSKLSDISKKWHWQGSTMCHTVLEERVRRWI